MIMVAECRVRYRDGTIGWLTDPMPKPEALALFARAAGPLGCQPGSNRRLTVLTVTGGGR